MSKKSFPTMVNSNLEFELPRAARNKAASFKRDVYPTLLDFGLLDDEHVQKYLNCGTMKEIYEDALKENRRSITLLEQKALVEAAKDEKQREDVWKFLRDSKSPVKSPKEDGFIFAPLPFSDYSNNGVITKALSVKDLDILVDEQFLKDLCVIKPSDEQRELWDMLEDFCEKFNKKNLHKKYYIPNLFIGDGNGIRPNVYGVLYKYQWMHPKR